MATIATTQKPFAERTAESVIQANSWQQFTSAKRVKFYPDNLRRTLKELGDSIFVSDAYNSAAYQEAIANGLASTISDEIGVQDFWARMTDLECETLEIDNGYLNFYNAENQKIDITPFTKKIVFEAHSSYYKERQKERLEAVALAKKQLDDLRKEIFRR